MKVFLFVVLSLCSVVVFAEPMRVVAVSTNDAGGCEAKSVDLDGWTVTPNTNDWTAVVEEAEVGALTLKERTAQPDDPAEGKCVIWQSNGTGYGDDGDLCIITKAAGVLYTNTVVNVVP